MLPIPLQMCQYVGFKICNYLRVLCTRFYFQQHTTRVHECGGCCSNGNSMPTRLLSLPSPTHSSLSLSLSFSLIMPAASADFGKKMYRTMAKKKVFHASPTHFSLPGNIGNHQQRETKRVAGCKLDVVVCLLPVACCTLPVARCLLPVAWRLC